MTTDEQVKLGKGKIFVILRHWWIVFKVWIWVERLGTKQRRFWVFSSALNMGVDKKPIGLTTSNNENFCLSLVIFVMSGLPTWLSGLFVSGSVIAWRTEEEIMGRRSLSSLINQLGICFAGNECCFIQLSN